MYTIGNMLCFSVVPLIYFKILLAAWKRNSLAQCINLERIYRKHYVRSAGREIHLYIVLAPSFLLNFSFLIHYRVCAFAIFFVKFLKNIFCILSLMYKNPIIFFLHVSFSYKFYCFVKKKRFYCFRYVDFDNVENHAWEIRHLVLAKKK